MAHHREVVSEMHRMFEARGFRAGQIIGGQSQKKRFAQTEAFQQKELDVIVCSIEAAAEGLTLTAAANLWLAELPYVPGRLLQAEDRCHRVGQNRAVEVQHILAKGTIDARISSALKRKSKVLQEMFDGEMRLDDETDLDGQSVFGSVMNAYLTNTPALL